MQSSKRSCPFRVKTVHYHLDEQVPSLNCPLFPIRVQWKNMPPVFLACISIMRPQSMQADSSLKWKELDRSRFFLRNDSNTSAYRVAVTFINFQNLAWAAAQARSWPYRSFYSVFSDFWGKLAHVLIRFYTSADFRRWHFSRNFTRRFTTCFNTCHTNYLLPTST